MWNYWNCIISKNSKLKKNRNSKFSKFYNLENYQNSINFQFYKLSYISTEFFGINFLLNEEFLCFNLVIVLLFRRRLKKDGREVYYRLIIHCFWAARLWSFASGPKSFICATSELTNRNSCPNLFSDLWYSISLLIRCCLPSLSLHRCTRVKIRWFFYCWNIFEISNLIF